MGKVKTKKVKRVKPTQEEILLRLEKPTKRLVAGTLQRYQNGAMASIFNESEMQALAQDTALEVARRVMIWNKNPRTKGAVNPQGCEAYFSRAFINQCQKMYEKYAKTDIRAGIQTVSSDEALAVAASRNLENPENDYMLQKTIEHMLKEVKQIDERINQAVTTQAQKEGREPKPEEMQFSYIILTKTLEGFEPNEIRKMINLSEVDYARHRKAALDLAKEKCPNKFEELVEHFESKMDYRLLTREVKKRKKSKNRERNFTPNWNFYIQSSMDNSNNKCLTTLYARVDLLENEDPVRDIQPKVIVVEKKESSIKKSSEIRQELWAKTKETALMQEIKQIGQEFAEKHNKKKAS